MSYWSLCWELQNLGGMEKPKSSLADRTDGRLEVTWALVLLKCSLLRGWKEHKTESVRVSVQGLPMCCKRSIKVCPCGVSVAAWQSPQAFGTCMEPRPVWKSSHAGRMWSSTGGRPHPVLCWAGRWLSQGGPLFLSTWAAGEEKVVCGGGGRWERESACSGNPSLCTLDFQLPAAVKGHDQTAPLLPQAGAVFEAAVGVWACPVREGLGVQGAVQDDPAGKSKAHDRETADVSLKFHFLCSSRKEGVSS